MDGNVKRYGVSCIPIGATERRLIWKRDGAGTFSTESLKDAHLRASELNDACLAKVVPLKPKRHKGWCSFAAHCPDEGYPVLVGWDHSPNITMGVLRGRVLVSCHTGNTWRSQDEPTHWRHLPRPPKKKE